jgi:nucleoside-diphosphate-sugar epimerase
MSETLVTGVTGFVGKAVVQRLLAEDESRRVAVAALGVVRVIGHPSTECSCQLFLPLRFQGPGSEAPPELR